jgi:hypothetical protein
MAYTSVEGRQQLLDTVAEATNELGFALASLGAAYEQLDEETADRLEDELFGPVQVAYGRLKRTHAQFADRHGLASGRFDVQEPGIPSTGAKGFIDLAADAVSRADGALAGLQDSPMVLEVGDAELRAGVTEARELIGGLRQRSRELVRTLGR